MAPSPASLYFLLIPRSSALGHEGDALGPEEDSEDGVEVAADLREERRQLGGAERDAKRAGDLAAVLLDLGDEGVLGRLAPRVVGVGDVPLLAHLVDHVRRRRHRLGRRVVERPEDVPAALGLGDRRVQAHADHVDGLGLFEDGHAGQADVGEVAALDEVDLVLEGELLRLTTPDVGLGFVVDHDGLDRPAVHAPALVDALHRHDRADQRRLAAGGGGAGERLHHAHLVGLGLPERLAPRRRHQDGSAQRTGRRRAHAEKRAARRLAAPPELFGPGFVLPSFRHVVASCHCP